MATLIRGGTVVNHDHSRRADVLVDGATIKAVGEKLDAPAGIEVIDAGGCYVLPGGIDPHTHMELMFMGTVSADDFESGTRAALAGGTTMIVDMCIPAPGQSMLAAYQDWRRKAEKAASDYGFHMSVTWWGEQVFNDMKTIVQQTQSQVFLVADYLKSVGADMEIIRLMLRAQASQMNFISNDEALSLNIRV